ncbi:hypothetical protein [Haloglomus litoreum]|uniref:hypothetical protein n=1 Tax=Haloglomus litoreum TaxID=3034026 RepID=UPI0023E7E057|nr:hypothetical protein [Haloglomus sp. DT116]
MHWRAVLAGVAWGVGYLGVCYLLAPLERIGLVAAPLLLGAGPLAGAAAGWLAHGGPAESTRHGLFAGAVTGLVFAAAFWHVLSVSRFNSLTPFGHGGAFYALKLTFAYSAGDFAVIAAAPGRVAGALAVAGAVATTLLGSYGGYVAATRENISFIEQ